MKKALIFVKKFLSSVADGFVAAVDPAYYEKCLKEARAVEQQEETRRLIEYCQQ